ncbi:hypothetical protein WJX82_009603 [Trebouxia sp. C0006]
MLQPITQDCTAEEESDKGDKLQALVGVLDSPAAANPGHAYGVSGSADGRTEEFPPPVVQALLCAGLIIRVCHLKNGADSRGVKAKTYVIIGKVPNPRHSSQEDGIVAESGKLRAAVWLVP